MKLSKKELQDYISSEVKKISIEEGWGVEFDKIQKIKEEKEISFEDDNVVTTKSINENEEINNIQLEEVKLLAEEIKRMKDLVDFRSPLLKKDI